MQRRIAGVEGPNRKEFTMIKLGSTVKDMYTGYTGIAIARTEWIYGCARILVEKTKLDKDGKIPEPVWFDEQRVQLVKTAAPKLAKHLEAAAPGGPRKDPGRRPDPKR